MATVDDTELKARQKDFRSWVWRIAVGVLVGNAATGGIAYLVLEQA